MNTNRFKTRWFRIICNADKVTVSRKIYFSVIVNITSDNFVNTPRSTFNLNRVAYIIN